MNHYVGAGKQTLGVSHLTGAKEVGVAGGVLSTVGDSTLALELGNYFFILLLR